MEPWRYDGKENAMKTKEITIYPMARHAERKKPTAGSMIFILFFIVAVVAGFYVCQENKVTSTYVVHTGDTLWSISQRYTAKEDIRSLYSRIIEDNNLDRNGTLKPGMKLKIRHIP